MKPTLKSRVTATARTTEDTKKMRVIVKPQIPALKSKTISNKQANNDGKIIGKISTKSPVAPDEIETMSSKSIAVKSNSVLEIQQQSTVISDCILTSNTESHLKAVNDLAAD